MYFNWENFNVLFYVIIFPLGESKSNDFGILLTLQPGDFGNCGIFMNISVGRV